MTRKLLSYGFLATSGSREAQGTLRVFGCRPEAPAEAQRHIGIFTAPHTLVVLRDEMIIHKNVIKADTSLRSRKNRQLFFSPIEEAEKKIQ